MELGEGYQEITPARYVETDCVGPQIPGKEACTFTWKETVTKVFDQESDTIEFDL